MLRRLPRGGSGGGGGKDSLQHRNSLEDSITVSFRYLDSSRLQKFDSSITDFTAKFPVPWHHYHLGNVGNPTHDMIFSPIRTSGWDIGFHQFDAHTPTDDATRFFTTTPPLTEIQYQLGSRVEQVLGLFHTQNILPNWNASFQYRLINSPGFFRNQNTNHNNYRFTSWFQSKNRRYQNFFSVNSNKLESAENGGLRNDLPYLDSSGFDNRSTIPTKLGDAGTGTSINFFANNIPTGSRYTNASFLMRHQYDLVGQKDSIVTDSTVIPLFYPRLRLELTHNYRTYNYRFTDLQPDPDYYSRYYNLDSPRIYQARDEWRVLSNDFSIYQFPDAKNSQQFFKAGASFDLLKGTFDTGTVTNRYHNFFVHGEYRNKMRNQKWDIEAHGKFYLNGMNAGDYDAHVSLKRMISKSLGFLELGFRNVNRTPQYSMFDSSSSFYIGEHKDFNKENTSEIFGTYELPQRKLRLSARYMLLSNYTYMSNYVQPEQYATLFNVLQVSAYKQFRIGGNWNWRTWLVIQQTTGDPPLNLPAVLTRNQVGYDGTLGFKNLLTSFGLEFRYFTPYKADRYAPVVGQFFNQNDTTVRMQLPDIGAYMHFRIRTFTAYVRVENLNTFSSEGWLRNNIVSPDYPYPRMLMRIGIYWSFVN